MTKNRKPSTMGLLMHIFLTIITGGLWLIVPFIQFMRSNTNR